MSGVVGCKFFFRKVFIKFARGTIHPFGSGFGFRLALGGLFPALLQPLGVRHLAARGEPAHPGAVGAFCEVDRDAQFAGGDGQAGDVVRMLVGDDDGVEGFRVFSDQLHAAEELAAAEAGVDQDAGAAAGDNGRVAFGAGGENGEAHHPLSIARRAAAWSGLAGYFLRT